MEQQLEQIQDVHQLIAPWILKNDFAKKVISLQMFTNPVANNEKLHIALVGDIASGKSEIIRFVSEAVPSGAFCSKKTTPAGMFSMLYGMDNSLIAVDEADKLDKQVGEQLLGVMANQTIDINMARAYGNMPAHGSLKRYINILLSCNPSGFMLMPEIPAYRQLNFKLPLLSRIHLFIPVKKPTADMYEEIAVSHEYQKNEEKIEIWKRKLREYIMEVKTKVPVVKLSDQMVRQIGRYNTYLENNSPCKDIISSRTMEGITSCVRARARMNMHSQANEQDFNYVKKIFNELYMVY